MMASVTDNNHPIPQTKDDSHGDTVKQSQAGDRGVECAGYDGNNLKLEEHKCCGCGPVNGCVIPGGQCKNQWQVIQKIGSGTCCDVYKVTEIHSGKLCALKVYHYGDNFAAAHDRENMLLSLLSSHRGQSPYLVKVVDDMCIGEHSCVVHELLDIDVHGMHAKTMNKGLSLYLIQKLLIHLLRGLQELHDSGFVHGDIKPANLLWNPALETLTLIDFSLSFHSLDSDVFLIQSSSYRAPEVTLYHDHGARFGHVMFSSACDMWSVGCLATQMFTACNLLNASRQKEVRDIIRQSPQKESDIYQGIENYVITQVTDVIHVRDMDSKQNGGEQEAVTHLREFILSCLRGDPTERITCKDALKHPFFSHSLSAEFVDSVMLPTRCLRLSNVMEENEINSDHTYDEIKEDIQDECDKYGHINRLIIPRSGPGLCKVYVIYREWTDSVYAYHKLTGRTFNDRTLIVTFFPMVHVDGNLLY